MVLNLTPFVWVHTILSLIALVAGVIVLLDMLKSKMSSATTAIYLVTAHATNITGFMLPADRILPSHIFGVISTIALVIACIALYAKHLAGSWRRIYVITATLGVYLLAFVTVAQAFLKVVALQPLAPTQSEPPFAIAQLVVLVIFVALGWAATKRFNGAAAMA